MEIQKIKVNKGAFMKRLRYMVVAAYMMSSLTAMTWVQGQEVVKPVVQEEPIIVEEKDVPLTRNYILESVKESALRERYEQLLGQEEAVREETLAKILCYTYQLSPLYDQEKKLSPYINRLKVEGLWPLSQDKGVLTNKDWQLLYEERLMPYTNNAPVHTQKDTKSYFEPILLDTLELSKMKAVIDGRSFPLYQLGHSNYISFSTLEQLGFDMYTTETEIVIRNPYSLLASDIYQEKPFELEKVKFTQKPIKIGNLQTYGIHTSDEIYIPIRGMNEYFQIEVMGNECVLTKEMIHTYEYVRLGENTVTNISERPINLAITHYFWDGKKIEESSMVIEKLQPKETYPLNQYIYENVSGLIHYSTIIHDMKIVDGSEIEIVTSAIQKDVKAYGQNDYQIFQNYEKKKQYEKEGYLNELFPETRIMGTMKYATKGLKKGEKVLIWGAEDGRCYYVLKDGNKITIPWGSVKIPPNPKVQKERASKADIEKFMNKQTIQSDTKYLVWTDLYRQLTYVFEKQNSKWVLIRTMLCTTGNNITPTPFGEYKLRAYVPYFGVEKGYRCKNAVQIFGDYLYHSVMFDKAGNYVLGGQVLGEQGSHGCIRLSPEDSEWFYNTMPLKTKVIIR